MRPNGDVEEAFVAPEFAPITSSAAFIQTDIEVVARFQSDWLSRLGREPKVSRLVEPFPGVLSRLEPLTTGVYPRELLIPVADGWVAYFSCSLLGTDGATRARYLARKLMCHGIAIRVKAPHEPSVTCEGQHGAVQFELFGPRETEFLNDIRAISLTHDGRQWSFAAAGELQPFEESDSYRERRKRDRLTPAMVDSYCRALGLQAFDRHAYGPGAILLETAERLPDGAIAVSLATARAKAGIPS